MAVVFEKLIVVLGSPNTDDGRLFGVAKERCARAAVLWQEEPECGLLLTGGFGDHFNRTDVPHAEYLRRHLVELGVPKGRFLEFALSLKYSGGCLEGEAHRGGGWGEAMRGGDFGLPLGLS